MKKLLLLLVFMGIYANAQIVNIPDANFKAKLLSANSTNNVASIETPFADGGVSDGWGVSNYSNIDVNQNGEIEVSEALNVKYLSIFIGHYDNQVNDLTGLESFQNLIGLRCFSTNIVDLPLDNLLNLKFLNCTSNHSLTSLDLSNLNNLEILDCSFNNFTTLNLDTLINLKRLDCSGNLYTALDFSNLVNLSKLTITNSLLTNIDLSGLFNIKALVIWGCPISFLDLSDLTGLKILNIQGVPITSINLSTNINLESITCCSSQITSLNVDNLSHLTSVYCQGNLITNLSLINLPLLAYLDCSYNQLNQLDLSSLLSLQNLKCGHNNLTTLNLNNNFNLDYVDFLVNPLQSVFMKNGHFQAYPFVFTLKTNSSYLLDISTTPLQYMCVDDSNEGQYWTNVFQNTIVCTDYCDFTPGGTFYTINGTNHYDENNNGCDAVDIVYPNLKINITNGTVSGSMIANTTGNYSIPVQAGTYTLTPQLENPSYFTVSPTTTTITFPTQASPFTQDFCITPNGIHKDVEIVIIPIGVARPGFPAQYKLIYKNKGNSTVDGTITVNFSANPDVMHFQSATPNISSQSATELYWDYTALHPFEIREINFTMLLNTPTATPALNAGNYLGIDADITPVADDENYIDNHSELKQLVVNSNDPNDKTCLEGQTISNSMIGQYVHYMIRFENTGTYPAQNIVVKDMIDTTKFDVSTLQMTRASHDCYTRINGNKVEFIFENINLPFDDATNDGYVVFKIKTKSTLAQNSSFSNTADIFFDYNFPITTNTATTNFANLTTQNAEKVKVSVYPNPAKNVVNIKSENQINSVTVFDIQGRQVQTKIVGATETILDISNLQQGNYLLKISTDKGVVSEKIIKE